MRKKRSQIWQLDRGELDLLVAKSKTFSEILKHFGLKNIGGNVNTLKKRLAFEQINHSHIPSGRGSNKNRPKGGPKYIDISEILVKDSPYPRCTVRRRLINENIIPYECAICEQKSFWNNKKLPLILDHINGKNDDHRLENLRFLCPNCNSQTATFCGRNNE